MLRMLSALCLLAVGCADVTIPPPQHLRVTQESDGAHVTWRDASTVPTEFWVERRVPGARFERIASVGADAREFVDVSPLAETSAYRVLALINGDPWSGSYSKEYTHAQR